MEGKKSLYIHMGQNKTGTSSLQRFCTKHRKELFKLFGMLYPKPPEEPAHRHCAFFPFRPEVWAPLRAEADKRRCSTLLLSNEDLCDSGVQDGDLQKIRALFPDFSINYIIYIKRIDDYCKDWYMQRSKRDRGLNADYNRFVNQLYAKQSLRLHPMQLLKRCEAQVGKERLFVKIYDRSLLLNNNIVDDFFALLGLTLPARLDRSRQYNQSIPARALPCITSSLRGVPLADPLRAAIYDKIINAFTAPELSPLNAKLVPRLLREVDEIDASYLPGYKELYASRAFDLSFPDATAPAHTLLLLDLLYSVLIELEQQKRRRLSYRIAQWCKAGFEGLRKKFDL